ncbi:isopenicillin N synthase family dioxygenase [Actinoplanes teichomyceticus]|uniref:Isopenicillin N synthase-like dioxygenase n=1 Tax=Actinoplanes teichomyceticus TaxID=1867 RepID=A0A561WQZ9_ACTTI|nr:2-oxoglutarate and iron-dependent oxygenase domain-containing protein [Actinoplanes teichomyceticus]TWG26287.1 isopenicillin N synthase-like dioxygenase [Actinoplanes teichomyceticus]GIF11366.1 2-oxobutyrate oxidase [Actinoplanes teichomyceticus]
MSELFPVIDLRDAERGPQARAEFLDRLRSAVHDIGFFQLVGHGVTGGDALLELARRFFALPEPERAALSILNSPHFRGYSEIGRELTQGIPDQRRQLDIGPERPSVAPGPGEPAYRWLAGPNQWPPAMPELADAVHRWTGELTGVAHRLLGLILESLEVPADFLDDVVTPDPHVHFKLLHYPGPEHGETGDGDQGVGIHKDYGILTLLLQDDKGGLQVAVEDGVFADVPVVPGAFVVNLGELLEVATRGYLRATTHRVVRPAPGVDRYSAPFFYNPRLDASMQPLPGPYVEAAGGVVPDPANPLFAGYGENVMKGMIRAFPQVIERHHPELLPTA